MNIKKVYEQAGEHFFLSLRKKYGAIILIILLQLAVVIALLLGPTYFLQTVYAEAVTIADPASQMGFIATNIGMMAVAVLICLLVIHSLGWAWTQTTAVDPTQKNKVLHFFSCWGKNLLALLAWLLVMSVVAYIFYRLFRQQIYAAEANQTLLEQVMVQYMLTSATIGFIIYYFSATALAVIGRTTFRTFFSHWSKVTFKQILISGSSYLLSWLAIIVMLGLTYLTLRVESQLVTLFFSVVTIIVAVLSRLWFFHQINTLAGMVDENSHH